MFGVRDSNDTDSYYQRFSIPKDVNQNPGKAVQSNAIGQANQVTSGISVPLSQDALLRNTNNHLPLSSGDTKQERGLSQQIPVQFNNFPAQKPQPGTHQQQGLLSTSNDPFYDIKVKHKGFYLLLWLVFLWESFGFGFWGIDSFLEPLDIGVLFLILDIIQWCMILFATLAVLKLIKAFENNEGGVFKFGRNTFVVLSVFELLFLVAWIIHWVQNGFTLSLRVICFVPMPMLLFAVLISKCEVVAESFMIQTKGLPI